MTNASTWSIPQRGQLSTLNVRSNAPLVVGNADDIVLPVTYALPAESTARSRPHSELPPPRKVEYTSAVPAALILLTNASRLLLAEPVRSNAPAVVGKLGDCVKPVT